MEQILLHNIFTAVSGKVAFFVLTVKIVRIFKDHLRVKEMFQTLFMPALCFIIPFYSLWSV